MLLFMQPQFVFYLIHFHFIFKLFNLAASIFSKSSNFMIDTIDNNCLSLFWSLQKRQSHLSGNIAFFINRTLFRLEEIQIFITL